MCGIAGFSLTPDSTIKPRKLANALLQAIEDRGNMASGFAWQDNEHMGFYKAPVAGSQLSLKTMPKDVRNVILHTRLATHGSIHDNRNNHPVLSPDENIALIHNGVIYNHASVRKELAMTLAEVDTSVIPAIIEQRGIEQIDLLDGDAAIAWFNRKEHDTMHLARYQHSPLVMAQVEDGSFIFCSTEALLWKVLISLNLTPVWMETAKELEYFTIRDGVIISRAMLPEPKYVEPKYDYTYYRHQTAGAKGSYYNDPWDDDAEYWKDNDEQWELGHNPYAPDGKNTDLELFTEGEYVVPTRVRYWSQIYDMNLKESEYLFYYPDEREIWLNELFIWANQDGVKLVDFGTLDKGEFVSVDGEDIDSVV